MKKRLFFSVLLGLIIPVSVVCQRIPSIPTVVDFSNSYVGNVKSCKYVIKFPYSEGRDLPSDEERVRYVNISRSGLEKEYHFSNGSTKSQTIVQNAGVDIVRVSI